jgi:pimeloyl-ACP methyl ester carboxylesterase
MNESTKWLSPILMGLLLSANALAQAKPTIERIACPTGVVATECGYLAVPEIRSSTNNKTIKIFVAVARSAAKDKFSDPVFMLSGGPGEKSGESGPLAAAFPGRDFVFFDQRGVGFSQPALECPEYLKAIESDDGLSNTEVVANAALQGLLACGERMKREGVNLKAFNTSESAADINDLRLALGYDKINLFGVSYGTRLAQEVMRSYPQGLRAVVLDSVIPPQIDRSADTPNSAEESRQNVFAACAAQASCQQKYPDLERLYNEIYDRLNQKPLQAKLAGQTGPLTGDALQTILFSSLYFPQSIGEFPKILYQLRQDLNTNKATSEAIIGTFVEQFFGALLTGISFGTFFATECQGELAFSSIAKLQLAYQNLPRWAKTIGGAPGVASERGFAVCSGWGLTEKSGQENDPLVSDVPTLLLGGEFDPVTPPRNLALAASGLSRATSVVIKGQAHSVALSSECGYRLMYSFLADPLKKLDISCASNGKLVFK